jgi:hypothetical protein
MATPMIGSKSAKARLWARVRVSQSESGYVWRSNSQFVLMLSPSLEPWTGIAWCKVLVAILLSLCTLPDGRGSAHCHESHTSSPLHIHLFKFIYVYTSVKRFEVRYNIIYSRPVLVQVLYNRLDYVLLYLAHDITATWALERALAWPPPILSLFGFLKLGFA